MIVVTITSTDLSKNNPRLYLQKITQNDNAVYEVGFMT